MNFDNIKEMADLTSTAIEIDQRIKLLSKFGEESVENKILVLEIKASYREKAPEKVNPLDAFNEGFIAMMRRSIEQQQKSSPWMSFDVNPNKEKLQEARILINSEFIPSLIDWLISMEKSKQEDILKKLKSLAS